MYVAAGTILVSLAWIDSGFCFSSLLGETPSQAYLQVLMSSACFH